MSKPLIRIHNLETNEIIDREMTDTEYSEALSVTEIKKAEAQARQAEAEAQAVARQALLNRLGLSEDEARLLLG